MKKLFGWLRVSNDTYDALKTLVVIILPAVSALYVGLSRIWGFPYAEEIAGTLALIATFLGAILQISSMNYYEEDEDVSRTD